VGVPFNMVSALKAAVVNLHGEVWPMHRSDHSGAACRSLRAVVQRRIDQLTEICHATGLPYGTVFVSCEHCWPTIYLECGQSQNGTVQR
jgi:hypothetical protein